MLSDGPAAALQASYRAGQVQGQLCGDGFAMFLTGRGPWPMQAWLDLGVIAQLHKRWLNPSNL